MLTKKSIKLISVICINFLFFKIYSNSSLNFYNNKRVTVLCYHSVVKNSNNIVSDYTVAFDDFKSFIEKLIENGFNFISIEDYENFVYKCYDIPEKAVILTFDDGYRSIFNNVYPYLKKKKIPFAVFVSAGLISNPDDKSIYMTKNQLKILLKNGVTIGCHGYYHKDLMKESGEIENEVYNSKVKLEKILDTNINYYAYCFGIVNEKIKDMVIKSGYKLAFDTSACNNDILTDKFMVNRFVVMQKTNLTRLYNDIQSLPLDVSLSKMEKNKKGFKLYFKIQYNDIDNDSVWVKFSPFPSQKVTFDGNDFSYQINSLPNRINTIYIYSKDIYGNYYKGSIVLSK